MTLVLAEEDTTRSSFPFSTTCSLAFDLLPQKNQELFFDSLLASCPCALVRSSLSCTWLDGVASVSMFLFGLEEEPSIAADSTFLETAACLSSWVFAFEFPAAAVILVSSESLLQTDHVREGLCPTVPPSLNELKLVSDLTSTFSDFVLARDDGGLETITVYRFLEMFSN